MPPADPTPRCGKRVTRSNGDWLPCDLEKGHGVYGGMGCGVSWSDNPEPTWNPRDVERRTGERRASADPPPPLTAERLAVAEQCFSSGDSGAGVEAIGRELLTAHAALTAQLAERTAELEEARRHTEWADDLVNSAHVDWLGEVARERQRRMQAEADCAQRTAERDAMQARIDAANSVDGVTADDAPLTMDALAPAIAWVEGVQHGQEMALAALAAPTEG